ncbi:hypothetical protein B1H19_18890 [Streptomyces gilvosporeus]|uniref:HTH cro/C1-type domain-containing protein n=1 Tax=Streptomyces gilvosporeus TaxID=553510 RepID=A0A1V0TSN3_9ACTN|nr:hypothetical protein B1H19_18890 [Streptomyces gilvosporeus]
MSHAAVSRILGAKATPTPDLLASMAPVLRVSLGELLVRAGIATEEQIERVGNRAAVDMPLTVEQAAALLGISDPQSVAMFVTFVTGLQQQEAQRKTDTDRQGTTGTER